MEKEFRYKAWANLEIMELISNINPNEFPEQRRLAIRLMNHTYVVDQIFYSHIQGTENRYNATNTEETPNLQDLKSNIAASDTKLVEFAKETTTQELKTIIQFKFTDGKKGAMTKSEILSHLLIHGAYHRGNVGMILTECGIDRPSDIFTRFLHLYEPERRG